MKKLLLLGALFFTSSIGAAKPLPEETVLIPVSKALSCLDKKANIAVPKSILDPNSGAKWGYLRRSILQNEENKKVLKKFFGSNKKNFTMYIGPQVMRDHFLITPKDKQILLGTQPVWITKCLSLW